MSPLVLGETLGESFNTLTANGKYFVQDCVNLPVPIQMQLPKNQKLFLNFLSHILNLHQILNILKQTMMAIANVFQKLQTAKNLLRSLSKKRRFRTRFDSQYVKPFQILAKTQWELFYALFLSLPGKLISKLSPVVLGEILGVFVNMSTVDSKYPVQDCKNLPLSIQRHLSEKQKTFSNFLLHFRNLHQILNKLKKKVFVIANAFPKLQTVKNVVTTLSKKCRFRTRVYSQDVKTSQILAISPWQGFYHVFSSFSLNLIWEMFPLVLGEIFGVFVNTLTANGKYSVQDCKNLQLPIQIQLCEKRKNFSEFFAPYLESTPNSKHF